MFIKKESVLFPKAIYSFFKHKKELHMQSLGKPYSLKMQKPVLFQ